MLPYISRIYRYMDTTIITILVEFIEIFAFALSKPYLSYSHRRKGKVLLRFQM